VVVTGEGWMPEMFPLVAVVVVVETFCVVVVVMVREMIHTWSL